MLAEYMIKNSCSRFKVAASLCDPDLLGFQNLVGLTEELSIKKWLSELKAYRLFFCYVLRDTC